MIYHFTAHIPHFVCQGDKCLWCLSYITLGWIADVRVPSFAPQKALISGRKFCIDVANDAKRISVDMRFHGQNMVFNEAFKVDKKRTRAAWLRADYITKMLRFFWPFFNFQSPAANFMNCHQCLAWGKSVYTTVFKSFVHVGRRLSFWPCTSLWVNSCILHISKRVFYLQAFGNM